MTVAKVTTERELGAVSPGTPEPPLFLEEAFYPALLIIFLFLACSQEVQT